VADISYPVPPEVGKVGKESPTFIQPVSERSDGIKSFFNKQSPAKAKPEIDPGLQPKAEPKADPAQSEKVKEEPEPEMAGEAKDEPESTKPSSSSSKINPVKDDPEGIESKITPKDEEKGLGDDSNAPNPVSDSKPSVFDTKVEDIEEKEDLSTTLTKRKRDEKGGAGQRTKVIRRDSDPKSAVSPILRPSHNHPFPLSSVYWNASLFTRPYSCLRTARLSIKSCGA